MLFNCPCTLWPPSYVTLTHNPNMSSSLDVAPLYHQLCPDSDLTINILVIFPQHIKGGRKEKCVTALTEFRAYLHYHMKGDDESVYDRASLK